jgi:hypothetical protein
VIRRYRTPLVALTAVLGLAGWARGSGMATFQLINTAPAGTPAVNQVVATILPAGSVPDGTNPSSSANPFSVLSGSSGFNVSNLVDFLGSGTLSNKEPVEVIKLQFDGAGFSPGGVVNFSLALDPGYTGPPPTLVLAPGTTGLSLLSYTPPGTPPTGSNTGGTPTGGGGTTTPPTTQVPEPVSIVFWSAAVGLGLIRARAFRRAHKLDI